MNKKILWLLLPLFLFFVWGFQDQDFSDREALIQAKFEERVSDYQKGVLRRCREKVLKEAGLRVDSILISRSDEIHTIDSLPRPPKPIKPNKPDMPDMPLEDKDEVIAPKLDRGTEGN